MFQIFLRMHWSAEGRSIERLSWLSKSWHSNGVSCKERKLMIFWHFSWFLSKSFCQLAEYKSFTCCDLWETGEISPLSLFLDKCFHCISMLPKSTMDKLCYFEVWLYFSNQYHSSFSVSDVVFCSFNIFFGSHVFAHVLFYIPSPTFTTSLSPSLNSSKCFYNSMYFSLIVIFNNSNYIFMSLGIC